MKNFGVHSDIIKKITIPAMVFLIISKFYQFYSNWFLVERNPIDFDAFYAAALLIRQGKFNLAYNPFEFVKAEMVANTLKDFNVLPWSYPPTTGLLFGWIDWFSYAWAYLLFVTISSFLFCFFLKKLSGDRFLEILLMFIFGIYLNITCGQNGFVTGALTAAFAYLWLKNSPLAGVPLAFALIKPHLFLGVVLYTALKRRWQMLGWLIATEALLVVIATAVFGFEIWGAFFEGAKWAQYLLSQNYYPSFRMISAASFVLSVHGPFWLAIGVQSISALCGLWVILCGVRQSDPAKGLALGILGSLLFSPYIYDYDVLILAAPIFLAVDKWAEANQKAKAVIAFCVFSLSLIGPAQHLCLLTVVLPPNFPIINLSGPILIALAVTITCLSSDRGLERKFFIGRKRMLTSNVQEA